MAALTRAWFVAAVVELDVFEWKVTLLSGRKFVNVLGCVRCANMAVNK